ncbi:LysM peptidoglycan-binding domain-containing protein, partial [Gemmatimonadota bacterium]
MPADDDCVDCLLPVHVGYQAAGGRLRPLRPPSPTASSTSNAATATTQTQPSQTQAAPPEPKPEEKKIPPIIPSWGTYAVKKGDTLIGIARDLGASLDEIERYNHNQLQA